MTMKKKMNYIIDYKFIQAEKHIETKDNLYYNHNNR